MDLRGVLFRFFFFFFDADKLLECMKKHIWIFVGVPNATHIYQTCDNQIFKMYQQMRKSLKQQWATTPGYPSMAMQHEVAVSVRSLKSAMSTETVAASCRAVGLLPFDPDRCKRAYGKIIRGSPVNEKIPDKKPDIHTMFPAGGFITNMKTIDWLTCSGKKWKTLYKQWVNDNKAIFDDKLE
eukprot:546844_1